jgi:hypothetical protein
MFSIAVAVASLSTPETNCELGHVPFPVILHLTIREVFPKLEVPKDTTPSVYPPDPIPVKVMPSIYQYDENCKARINAQLTVKLTEDRLKPISRICPAVELPFLVNDKVAAMVIVSLNPSSRYTVQPAAKELL